MFSIADEVVSNRVFRSLRRKNMSRLSSRAYAYRADLSAHDAIAHMQIEFERHHRLYVAEFDFSRFFDDVKHEKIWQAFHEMRIASTAAERMVIRSFLGTPPPSSDPENGIPRTSERGLHQGTSISLFLANLVAADLDRGLERLGVGFVRYADDTVIWSPEYGQITKAVDLLHSESEQIGSEINSMKSKGVSLLELDGRNKSEMRSVYSVDFLGHSLGLRSTKIRISSVEKIKRRITELIHNNLTREPIAISQNLDRLDDYVDRDYVVFLMQLRRYLYGSTSESAVRRQQVHVAPGSRLFGVMAFFPLTTNDEQLRELDGWLSRTVWLALRKRYRLIQLHKKELPKPAGLSREGLFSLRPVLKSGKWVDLRLPSFVRAGKMIRHAVGEHGLEIIRDDRPLYLY